MGKQLLESKDRFSKKALAYLSDVFPISPLLASAIVNKIRIFQIDIIDSFFK